MNTMNILDVMRHLPHRYPFLLVDRVLEMEPGKHIVALKNVTMNEPHFPGHFPHHPVMPGVLILEALAQTAAILSYVTEKRLPDDSSVVYFAGIDGARFKKPVTPGDQLILKAEVIRNMRGIWKYATRAEVNGELVAEAEMMAALRDM